MSMDDFKTKGNDAFKAKKYQEAIDWYTKAVAVDPNCEAAGALYSNRAASWQGLGKFENAMNDAEECIRVRPTWLKGHFRKGVALQSLNRFDDARKAFQDALRVEPGNQEVEEKIHALNVQLKERNDRAAPGACKTADEAKLLGNSLFAEGKYERAALFYSRAIDLQKEGVPEKANYYANRAACYQQTHMYDEMVKDCDAALAIDPKHIKALIRRGVANEGMEKWKLALADYQAAQAVSPGLQNVSQGVLRCQRALRG